MSSTSLLCPGTRRTHTVERGESATGRNSEQPVHQRPTVGTMRVRVRGLRVDALPREDISGPGSGRRRTAPRHACRSPGLALRCDSRTVTRVRDASAAPVAAPGARGATTQRHVAQPARSASRSSPSRSWFICRSSPSRFSLFRTLGARRPVVGPGEPTTTGRRTSRGAECGVEGGVCRNFFTRAYMENFLQIGVYTPHSALAWWLIGVRFPGETGRRTRHRGS
jgi:hypothetical protein